MYNCGQIMFPTWVIWLKDLSTNQAPAYQNQGYGNFHCNELCLKEYWHWQLLTQVWVIMKTLGYFGNIFKY